MKAKCPMCGKRKKLTKHSLKGNHKPPFIRICRACHNKRDKCVPLNKKEKIARNRK